MIGEKITSKNCEAYCKGLNREWHPAERQLATIYAFLGQNGMKMKPGATAIERMIGHMENYLAKPFKVPDCENLPTPTFDADGYPTDGFLSQIENFAAHKVKNGASDLLDVVISAWHYDGHYATRDGNTVKLSTGGWSGNESIISAMKWNRIFWGMCYRSHRTGGHYEFEIKPETP